MLQCSFANLAGCSSIFYSCTSTEQSTTLHGSLRHLATLSGLCSEHIWVFRSVGGTTTHGAGTLSLSLSLQHTFTSKPFAESGLGQHKGGHTLKGSLLQKGFCANFSDLEAKSCSPKNAPKNVPKSAPKTECFHRNFPPKYSPNFRLCFSAVRTTNATEKRTPKNSARKSITAQSKIQNADEVGWEPLNTPIWEAKVLLKNRTKFLQLAVLHLSAYLPTCSPK